MSRHLSARYTSTSGGSAAVNRVRLRTLEHLARYQTILDDLTSQGIAAYVPTEHAQLVAEIAQAREILHEDAFAGREASRSIGARVGPLPRVARELRSQAESAGRQAATLGSAPGSSGPSSSTGSPIRQSRITESETSAPSPLPVDLEGVWREELAEWNDVLSRELAYASLQEVRARLVMRGLPTNATRIRSQVRRLREKYAAIADEMRTRELAKVDPPNAPDQRQPGEDAVEPDDIADAEELRREAVGAVFKALVAAGFLTDKPRRIRDAGQDQVLIRGFRPGGAEASFRMGPEGQLEYRFEGYRGSDCVNDIDAIIPKLRDVYGIRISDERVIWSNPDDEDGEAKPLSEQGRSK